MVSSQISPQKKKKDSYAPASHTSSVYQCSKCYPCIVPLPVSVLSQRSGTKKIPLHACNLHATALFHLLLQMSAHTWIQTVLLGLLIVNSVTSQTCSTPFDAVFAGVTDLVASASSLLNADPEMRFFTETLRFTAEETNQVMENAIRQFNTQFGIDLSNVEPNEANQRFFEHGTFEPIANPFNATIIANSWIVNGNTKSKCFPIGSGFFALNFNDTTMLHGVYGGEEGKQINAGDFANYGYFAIFDACAQQPILLQFQADVPARILPVEGWLVEEYQLYNRQLGRGRAQVVVKNRPSPDDPTMIIIEIQQVFSFP